MSRVYGCIPTKPAEKTADLAHTDLATTLPASVDLRASGFLPPVVDQGQLGACTANAGAAAYSFDLAKQGGPKGFAASRLFMYFNERSLEGTTGQDAGASITDTAKSLGQFGAPTEPDWPYTISKFTIKPPSKAYADGKSRTAVKYSFVAQNKATIMGTVAAGFPVLIGFMVYESFENPGPQARTGAVPYPDTSKSSLGGHCVLIVGYSPWGVICRNSWGKGWGVDGYFVMPWSYVLDPNLAFDFWTIQLVGVGVVAKLRKLARRVVGWFH